MGKWLSALWLQCWFHWQWNCSEHFSGAPGCMVQDCGHGYNQIATKHPSLTHQMCNVHVPIHASGCSVWPFLYQNKIVSAFFCPHATKAFSEKVFPHKRINTVSNAIQNPCKISGLQDCMPPEKDCRQHWIGRRGRHIAKTSHCMETLQWAGRLG